MSFFLKQIPHLLSWSLIALILMRGFSGRRIVAVAGNAGFAAGAAGIFLLSASVSSAVAAGVIKSVLGIGFLALWGVSVAVLYRSTGRVQGAPPAGGPQSSPVTAGLCAAAAGMVAGAVPAGSVTSSTGGIAHLFALILVAVALGYGACLLEKRLPASFIVSPAGMLAATVALLLFSASASLRLDLFAPLSMKVMKGIHDFVHQFMESILVPDHLFVRSVVWKYIGFLFGKEVGFWGGIIIWFTPAVLIVVALMLQRLPSVAHVRQGAHRRRLMAVALRNRRLQMLMPTVALTVFAAAAYQSSHPTVEYWDPKPVPVSSTPGGEIVIPKKGDIDLEDGKLHKYLFRQGGREVRFFVLMSPAGQLTVDLDACAICKPEGYGQAEGSVICYYCKTLIPLDTVGKPGGCNPVPVPFSESADSVVINATTIVNSWTSTVQATTGGGK